MDRADPATAPGNVTEPGASTSVSERVKYDAFISYCHRTDAAPAAAIEHGLERLARPWYRLRAMAVFRDESDLAAEHDLSGAITRALDDTRFFVLVASRGAAASPWVDKEVAQWCDKPGGAERLIVVVTDGEFEWDGVAGALSATTDAVSPAVHKRFATEPLYIDLRWAQSAEDLSLRDSRFRSAIVLIAATIRGMAPADLESEDVRLHRRARRLERAAIGTVLVLALTASIAAFLAVANARRADQRARQALARQLGLAALDLPASKVDQALLLSLAAADLDSGDGAGRFQASRVLIGRYSRLEQVLYGPTGTTSIRAVAMSPTADHRILAAAAGTDGTTSVLTWARDARSDPITADLGSRVAPTVSFTAAGTALVGTLSSDVVVLDSSGSPSTTLRNVLAIDATRGLAVTSTGSVQLKDVDDGSTLAESSQAPTQIDLHFGRAATFGDHLVVLDARGPAQSAESAAAGTTVVAAGPSDDPAALTATHDGLVAWRRIGDQLTVDRRVAIPAGVGQPHHAVLSPDGRRVLVVGDEGAAVVDLTDGAPATVDVGGTGFVSVDPSGRFAAVGGARLAIWDLADGRPTFTVPRPVNAMAWSGPCGRAPGCTLVTAGESLDAWQPQTHRSTQLTDQTNAQAVDVSGDGRTVVTAGWGPTVEVWRLLPLVDDSGASPIRASDIVAGPGKCPARPGDLRAESPDHTLVVTQSADRTTTLCRAADGSRVARARLTGSAGPADAVAVDAQGDVAVGDAEGFVTSYQRAGASFTTGRAIDVRLGGEPVHVTALAYHAGTIAAGIRPATTDEPARVFVWPVDTGGTPASFATDYMQVPAVALLGTSAEDLAVAGRDQDDGPVILQIWDTASRRRLGRSLSGLSGDVLALTGDETTVAAADSRGVAYRWELDRDPRRDICSIVGRPLTDAEWRTLAGGALGGFARDNVCGASPPTTANPPTTG